MNHLSEKYNWFNTLHEKREKALDVFMDPEYINVFNGVIDKYCDSAHFIYELLQNADDAKATEVEMVLSKDKFIFRHNGEIRFTVSDPAKSVEDRQHNRLGHINAITAIGFSSKNQTPTADFDDIKIGKFGVGFKAVFQYTTTPYIYDDPFCFKIENYIVPTLLNDTYYQQKGKTVFVIPFDRQNITAKQAYSDIERKLESLEYPQLFLFNLQTITWSTSTNSGKIEKRLLEKYDTYCGVTPSLYALSNLKTVVKILLMTREVTVPDTAQKHPIAIGYIFDDRGHIRTDIHPKINCFFPTKENIETCYIIHAPFALVDNRQQIKRNNDINDSLIESVGQLAADSIVILKNISVQTKRTLLGDNIFELMHHNLESIRDEDDIYDSRYDTVDYAFADYYNAIIEKEPVFLSRQKKYISKDYGWWGDEGMRRLLTTEQLDCLTKIHQDIYREDDKEIIYDFILCSLNTNSLDDFNRYGIDVFEDSDLAERLCTRFIKEQDEEWLSKLYKYILDNRLIEVYQINNGAFSLAPMRNAEIIMNECGDFVSPYENRKLRVFFRTDGINNPEATINSNLYARNEQFRLLVTKLGVQEPSILDRIRIQLNNKPEKNGQNNLLTSIIKYSNSCDADSSGILYALIREKLTLCCKTVNAIEGEEEKVWCHIKDIIADSSMLLEYYRLSEIEGMHYIDRDFYKATIKEVGQERFNRFLESLDLRDYPAVISDEVVPVNKNELKESVEKFGSKLKKIKTLEGLKRVLAQIETSQNPKELSHYIWNALINGIKSQPSYNPMFKNDYWTYFYYTERTHIWQSCTLIEWLRNYRWLFINGKFVSLEDGIYKEDILRELYEYNEELFTRLNVEGSPRIAERESIKKMSEETQEAFSLGEAAKRLGVKTPEELLELINMGRATKQANEQRQTKIEQRNKEGKESQLPKRKKSERLSDSDFNSEDIIAANEQKKPAVDRPAVNLEEALAGFEEKASLQREEIENVMTLRETVANSEKYSYGWLQALMSLEVQSSGVDSASGKRSISIKFERVLVDREHTNRIILNGASRYIPAVIEDVDGIPVTLYFRNGEKPTTIVFDNASVKEDALMVRGNSSMEPIIQTVIQNIDLIGGASVDLDKPVELIKKWQNLIDNLPFEADEEIVKNSLRNDIKFIFGPPGTGKTTTLARRIITLMEEQEKCRILVLAPTNKACDVLAKKILELEPDDDSWLWRFVTTMDSELEDEEIVYQRDSDIMRQKQVCVVSTMARYSFDGFEEGLLNSMDWNYVIIDEASMIPLYQILPPIFNKHSGEIWIAGDPFQIEPIVNIDFWKDENIYKMVDLDNFVNPKTTPVQFDVELLMKQYRSIPVIGELYSQYMYGGKLLHDRSAESHRVLNIGIKESPLNVISFPVTKDSIFDTKRLMGSNIHIYSVLFTVEFLNYISAQLSTDKSEEIIKIGVISPYGVEIQSIQKLYNQTCEPHDNISVTFGTSHGFQGDQCDIVIAVMNPPSSGLKRNAELTFINKPNILNVAVSRAKDYLFLIMPEKEYELFPMLRELKRLGKIMVSTKCNKFYTSDEIEKIMFGKIHHIEDNTYVTTHQITNIYSDALAKYEVRIGEQALDIQINDNAR